MILGGQGAFGGQGDLRWSGDEDDLAGGAAGFQGAVGGGRLGERVALDGGAQSSGRGFGECAGFEGAQAAAPLDHGGAENAFGCDGACGEFGGGEGERAAVVESAAGPAVDDVLSALAEEVDGGAGGGGSDGVVDDGGASAEAVEVDADVARPVGEGVVDGEVGAVGPDEGDFGGTMRRGR